MYLHSATSHGDGFNNAEHIALGYPQKTIYESLDEAGFTWTNYFGEGQSS